MSRLATFAAVGLVSCFAATTHAEIRLPTRDPIEGPEPREIRSVWSRAEQPEPIGLAAKQVHLRAMELYYASEAAGGPTGRLGGFAIASLQGAKTLLENTGARMSKDLRLRYDLGRVLVRLRNCDDAVSLLADTIAREPTHFMAATAYFETAICHALSGRHDLEELAYEQGLKLEDEPIVRAIMWANMAESRMALGKLAGAAAAVELSLAIEPDAVLPYWTLAMIRDRQGDPAAAIAAASRALLVDPNFDVLDGPDVFFEPEYERHWYHALGELALSERSGLAETEVDRHLIAALMHFHGYVDFASSSVAATKEPAQQFLAIAKERVTMLEKQLAKRVKAAKDRAAKMPKVKGTPGTPSTTGTKDKL